MRHTIEERLHISAHDIWLSEIIGPGVSCECKRRMAHVAEDHLYLK